MPTYEIPISEPTDQTQDEATLKEKTAYLIDGYRNADGDNISRPGLTLFTDLGLGSGSAIDGGYWWDERQCYIAVCYGRTFRVDRDAFGTLTTTELTGITFPIGEVPSFATDGINLYIAAKSKIAYTDGVSLLAWLADPDAPQKVRSLGYLDTYLIAWNRADKRFYWSQPADDTNWSALSFAEAGASPDLIEAGLVLDGELYHFGKKTLEVWQDDGQNPFSRVPGAAYRYGISAPYSPAVVNDTLSWLDHKRRVVQMQGRGIQRVPCSYDKAIRSFTRVDDCTTDVISIDNVSYLLWRFPSAGRAFIQDSKNDWFEWGSWSSVLGAYTNYIGRTHTSCDGWNLQLVGSRIDSKIYVIDRAYNTDAGGVIRFQLRTGHVDHDYELRSGQLDTGGKVRKRCNQIRIKARRGGADLSPNPQMVVRWRDNGTSSWSNEKYLSLGGIGDTKNFIRMHRLGIYVTRQWEFTASDGAPIVLADAEEDVEFLR